MLSAPHPVCSVNLTSTLTTLVGGTMSHSRGLRLVTPFPAYALKGRGMLHSTPACLSVVALDLRLCNQHHHCALNYTTRQHRSAATLHTHDYNTILPVTSSFVHDIQHAPQSATRDITTRALRSTTSLRRPCNCLAPLSGLTGASRNCTSSLSSVSHIRSRQALRQPRTQLLQEMLPRS